MAKKFYYTEGQKVFIRGDKHYWVIENVGPHTGEMKLRHSVTDELQFVTQKELKAIDVDYYGPAAEGMQAANAVSSASAYHDSILLEAESLVHGDRHEDYGHPLDDFNFTAVMWSSYLRKRGLLSFNMPILEADDIAIMMIMVKISRQANRRKRDNLVDIAGYAETAQMCVDENDRREDQKVSFGDEVSGD